VYSLFRIFSIVKSVKIELITFAVWLLYLAIESKNEPMLLILLKYF